MPRSNRDTDVCILGAGPHGLAAAIHLREADPDIRVTVLDPSGSWLSEWNNQFARAEIEVLRSPIVHHPGSNPYALSDYIDEQNLTRFGAPVRPADEGYLHAVLPVAH